MVRGTGKFKQKRGGGRSFSKDMTLDSNGVAVSSERRSARNKTAEDIEEEEEEDSEEEEEDEEEDEDEGEEVDTEKLEAVRQSMATLEVHKAPKPQLTREERRQLKKEKSQGNQSEDSDDDDDADLVNPNHVSGKKMAIADLDKPRELSRREREAKEKREAQERYWKLHREGKTDQAKADLARLAQIRKDREAAQAKRTAEAEVKAAEAEAKKAAQRGGRRV